MILLSKENVGKTVVVDGKADTIASVSSSLKQFRLTGEVKLARIIHDYGFHELEASVPLKVSLNDGASWMTVVLASLDPAKQDLLEKEWENQKLFVEIDHAESVTVTTTPPIGKGVKT